MRDIKPVLAALRRYKAGVLLIGLQIALTLAIVCNALSIIEQRLEHLAQPTGLDEPNLFIVTSEWATTMSQGEREAQTMADLAGLRGLSGVTDAAVTNAFPLRGNGWDGLLSYTPDQRHPTASTALYFSDEHLLDSFGVRLIAGRNFRADEADSMDVRDTLDPPVIIISRALAQKLYPAGNALGQHIYTTGSTRASTIVGIVDVLQAHSADQWASPFVNYVTIMPRRLMAEWGSYYVVRAKPGQRDAMMKAARETLFKLDPMRIISDRDGLRSFERIRDEAYDRDRGMALLMGIISLVLLIITAAGIVGLTSFWVGQRRKQIGVRRALGARRSDILRYFLVENLVISAGGTLFGLLLAVVLNLWLVVRFEMQRMPVAFVLIGVVLLLALGQLAVLAPALRASRVPPVEATRSV